MPLEILVLSLTGNLPLPRPPVRTAHRLAPFLSFLGTIMTQERTMDARVGRAKQRYNDKGERLVAGVVPLTASGSHVLLISSTRRSAWVLPKGGWETDEVTEVDAATREAWEEAGIVIKISKDLGIVSEKRKDDELTPEAPRASYRFFEAVVVEEKEEWPEMKKRNREWMTFAQASKALAGRPELLEALGRCGIKRN